MVDRFTAVLSLTVVAGIVATVVASKNSAQILSSGGQAWAQVLNASEGHYSSNGG